MRYRIFFAIPALLFAISGFISAQETTVTGSVRSAADGLPVQGVSIEAPGKMFSCLSDLEGNYSIVVPEGTLNLVFSFPGMDTQSITLGVNRKIDVILVSSTKLVNTALGIVREDRTLGYSLQVLKASELTGGREQNIINYLTAHISGMQVSKTAGGMGGSNSITIRGYRSMTGNNQPLFVVDGFPVTNENYNQMIANTLNYKDYGDGIADVNPEDVESITVLKGPNASSLYGSGGANGVVLITTKSGSRKKGIGVEVSSDFSVDRINVIPTFQNKYATGYEETNLYGSLIEIPDGSGKFYETMDTWHGDSWGPPLDGRRTIVDPFVYPGDMFKKTRVLLPQPADNVRNFYETGVNTYNTLAISGGNGKTTARFSIGNATSKGVLPNWKLNKQSVALRVTSQVTARLTFDTKVNYIRNEGANRPSLGSGLDNVNKTFITMGRYVPMPWLKEYYEKTRQPGSWPGVNYNPYYVANELKNNDHRDRLTGYVSGSMRFTEWLNLTARAGTDSYSENRESIWPIGAFGSENYLGRYTEIFHTNRNLYSDVFLAVDKKLSETVSVSATIGGNYQKQKIASELWDRRDLKEPGIYESYNARDIRHNDYQFHGETKSAFFSAQLEYKNLLFLDATGRKEWNAGSKKGFFPSVSTGFAFSDALGWGKSILSFGKVRASWARVGNGINPGTQDQGWFQGTVPYYDLKSESTESWEFGTDLRFMQNRFGFDMTLYRSKTTNQILPVMVNNGSGYSTRWINSGEIQNKGLELVLIIIAAKMSNGFTWEINANFARNRSTVVSLAPGIETVNLVSMDGAYPNAIEARQGQPYGNIVGYGFKRAPDGQKITVAGIYQATPTRQVLGNILPDWIGGLSNTISFKNFTLNVLLDFVQGREISSATRYQMEAKGTGIWTMEGRRIRDKDDHGNPLPYSGVLPGVEEVRDGNGNLSYVQNTTAVSGQNYWAARAWNDIGEEFVVDGSYVSLREVMLSYNFRNSLSGSPFDGIILSVYGRNLFYPEEHLSDMGISPESAPNTSAGSSGMEMISLPTTRTFGINLKVIF